MALRSAGRRKPVPVQWFAGQSVSLVAIGVSSDTTDGADVLAGAVDPVAAGSSASTDGADVLQAATGPVVAASSDSTDGADVAAGQVGPVVAASVSKTDGADALAGSVSPLIGASSAVSDGADALASAASPLITASSAIADGADAATVHVATVIDLGSTYLDGADLLAASVASATAIVVVPYRTPQMSDITTVWNASLSRGDWVQAGASLQSGADVVTAVLISLFTDRIANTDDAIPDGTTDPRGWWADDPQHPIGSRLWLLGREKQIDSVPQRAKDYCTEALKWLIDDGVVAKFDITTAWVRTSLLGVQIVAYRSDGSTVNVKFSAAWNLSGVVFTVGESPLQ